MKSVALLSAILAAAALAACSAAPDQLTLADRGGNDDSDVPAADGDDKKPAPATGDKKPGTGTSPTTPPADTTPPAGNNTPTPTPGVSNATAKQFFFSDVHTALAPTCGACHGDAGPGPAWFFADKDKTYISFENLGYISKTSRILLKGVHGAAPALTAAQVTVFNTWVDKEIASRGAAAPTNIKEKLGGCMDEAKFNAIGLQTLRVTRRQGENNNNCTGCKDGTQCLTCHSADPATGVILANGNNNVPANYTFLKAKEIPFMDLYIGTNGAEIVGSKKLALKATATAADKPYTHPMYAMPATMQAQIDAFAADVSAKYKAGLCK